MPKGEYVKWSEVPEWKRLVIDIIKEIAEKNKTFTLGDVYELCNKRFIHLSNGKKDVAQAFNLMVSEEFFYAKVIKRTQIKGKHTTICQSFIYERNANEKVG